MHTSVGVRAVVCEAALASDYLPGDWYALKKSSERIAADPLIAMPVLKKTAVRGDAVINKTKGAKREPFVRVYAPIDIYGLNLRLIRYARSRGRACNLFVFRNFLMVGYANS